MFTGHKHGLASLTTANSAVDGGKDHRTLFLVCLHLVCGLPSGCGLRL